MEGLELGLLSESSTRPDRSLDRQLMQVAAAARHEKMAGFQECQERRISGGRQGSVVAVAINVNNQYTA
jgi:hypothetical protein